MLFDCEHDFFGRISRSGRMLGTLIFTVLRVFLPMSSSDSNAEQIFLSCSFEDPEVYRSPTILQVVIVMEKFACQTLNYIFFSFMDPVA